MPKFDPNAPIDPVKFDPNAPIGPAEESAPKTDYTANPKGEGTYKLRNPKTGGKMVVPYSNVQALPLRQAGWQIDPEDAARYQKDASAAGDKGLTLSSLLSGNSPGHKAIDEAAQTVPVDTSSAGSFARTVGTDLGAGSVRLTMQPFAHPIDTVKGLAKTAMWAGGQWAGVPMPESFNPITPIVQQFGENPSGEAVAAIPQIVLALAGMEGKSKGLAPRALEKVRNTYGPREVEIGGTKVPVLVGEANPDSGPGRTQVNLKRSGLAPERFEKVENAQQEAVKNIIRNMAQKTSGAIGPMQVEPSDVLNDAATASYAQAAPLYNELDASLVNVPDTLQKVSRITQDAINKARKLGVSVGEGVDLTKITPEKDGTIQWGDTRISKATSPERWAQLVKDGIIDDSGGATPLKAYRQVRSQLLKMQRASSDAGVRYAIGKDIERMTENIESALKGTPIEKNWSEANRLWSQGKALQDVSEAIRDVTKGTPAAAQAPGLSPVQTKLQGASFVSKMNDLYKDGTLERAFTHEEVSNIRQAADILDRIQRTSIGHGSGESASMSRGLTHALRGNAGPLAGAAIGGAFGGLKGAEMGAGLGFITQKIGEQGLVRVMTNLDGVAALKELEAAKTPAQAQAAIRTILIIGGPTALAPRKNATDEWAGQ